MSAPAPANTSTPSPAVTALVPKQGEGRECALDPRESPPGVAVAVAPTAGVGTAVGALVVEPLPLAAARSVATPQLTETEQAAAAELESLLNNNKNRLLGDPKLAGEEKRKMLANIARAHAVVYDKFPRQVVMQQGTATASAADSGAAAAPRLSQEQRTAVHRLKTIQNLLRDPALPPGHRRALLCASEDAHSLVFPAGSGSSSSSAASGTKTAEAQLPVLGVEPTMSSKPDWGVHAPQYQRGAPERGEFRANGRALSADVVRQIQQCPQLRELYFDTEEWHAKLPLQAEGVPITGVAAMVCEKHGDAIRLYCAREDRYASRGAPAPTVKDRHALKYAKPGHEGVDVAALLPPGDLDRAVAQYAHARENDNFPLVYLFREQLSRPEQQALQACACFADKVAYLSQAPLRRLLEEEFHQEFDEARAVSEQQRHLQAFPFVWIHTAAQRKGRDGKMTTVERLLPVFLIHRERLCGSERAIATASCMPGLFSAASLKIRDPACVQQLLAACGGELDLSYFQWDAERRTVKVKCAYNETCGLDHGGLVDGDGEGDGERRLRQACFRPVEDIVHRVQSFRQHCLDQEAGIQLSRYGQEYLLGVGKALTLVRTKLSEAVEVRQRAFVLDSKNKALAQANYDVMSPPALLKRKAACDREMSSLRELITKTYEEIEKCAGKRRRLLRAAAENAAVQAPVLVPPPNIVADDCVPPSWHDADEDRSDRSRMIELIAATLEENNRGVLDWVQFVNMARVAEQRFYCHASSKDEYMDKTTLVARMQHFVEYEQNRLLARRLKPQRAAAAAAQ